MISKDFTINNKTGLHARPAAMFVKEAGKYKCSISVVKGTKKADGKSIIGVLSLGINQGSQIVIQACGADEVQAVAALGDVIHELAVTGE